MKMKYLFLFCLILLNGLGIVSAQMLTKWNRDAPIPSTVATCQAATDASGYTYLCTTITDTTNIVLTKFDPAGYTVWSKRYGSNLNLYMNNTQFLYNYNGYLWIIGQEWDSTLTFEQVVVLQIDTAGNELLKFYPQLPGWAIPTSYHLMPNGELVMGIFGDISGDTNEYHLQCFAPGDSVLLWDSVYDPGEFAYWSGPIEHDAQGNILLGYSAYIGPDMHYYVRKLTATGTLLWTWDQLLVQGTMTWAFARDGRSLVAKGPFSSTNWDILQLDPAGNVAWQNSTVGIEGPSLLPTADRGWLVSGISAGNPTIVKLDSLGTEITRFSIPNGYSGNIYAREIYYAPDSAVVYATYSASTLGANWEDQMVMVRCTPAATLLDVTTLATAPTQDQFGSLGHAFHANGDLMVSIAKSNNSNSYFTSRYLRRYCTLGCQITVGGNVFADFDSDCIQDSTEPSFPYPLLNLDQNQSYIMGDSTGHFEEMVASGNHGLTQELPPYLFNSCPAAGYNFIIDSLHPTAFNLDFGVALDSNYHDMQVDVELQSAARPGFTQLHSITYQNQGVTTDTGMVTLVLDTVFHFVSASPAPTAISGNTYSWNFATLLPFSGRTITLETTIPALTAINVPFANIATVTSAYIDAVPSNNVDTAASITTGSFDPNHKGVQPAGQGPNGGILMTDSLLTYTIQFQNVGTDTAFTVIVRDAISPYLDLGTLHVINASHAWTMSLQSDRTIVWTFAHIGLPDSATNPAASNGFIKYEIQQLPNLPIGTRIENEAYIYFDFNAPVITNTVVNTLVPTATHADQPAPTSQATALRLFPNPARHVLNLQLPRKMRGFDVEVMNAQGLVVQQYHIDQMVSAVELDVQSLPAGIYFARVNGGGAAMHGRWVKL